MANHNAQGCLAGVPNEDCHDCTYDKDVALCCRDAEWMDWGEWSSCDLPCGEESKTRTRHCADDLGSDDCPESEYQLTCEGNGDESMDCGNPCCPGKSE